MYRVLLAVALLTLTFGFTVPEYAWAGERPPLSPARVAGELLVGGTGGLAGFTLPMLALSTGEGEDWGGMGAMFCVVPITYPLSAATGVCLVGSIGDETGSFLATLVGSYLGAIAGLIVTLGLDGIFESDTVFLSTIALFPSAGATIGFNLSRK